MLSKLSTTFAFVSSVYAGSEPNPPAWDTLWVKEIKPGQEDA